MIQKRLKGTPASDVVELGRAIQDLRSGLIADDDLEALRAVIDAAV